MTDRVAIVTITDTRYLPAACCALYSCQTSGTRHNATYILLCNAVSKSDLERAKEFFAFHSMEVTILSLDRRVLSQKHYQTEHLSIGRYVTATTYGRLHLHEYLCRTWDRVLYIDADMRVCRSLDSLLQEEMHGMPLAAVHDFNSYIRDGISSFSSRVGLRDPCSYFNAGLLLFDWQLLLEGDWLRNAQDYVRGGDLSLACVDQDALNVAFENNWCPLDPRWNYMTPLDTEYYAGDSSDGAGWVYHYTGPLKPWMAEISETHIEHASWYRGILSSSPWSSGISFGDEVAIAERHGRSDDREPQYCSAEDFLSVELDFVELSKREPTIAELSTLHVRARKISASPFRRESVLEFRRRLMTVLRAQATFGVSVPASDVLAKLQHDWETLVGDPVHCSTLDERILYCIEMPSSTDHVDVSGERYSTGLPGHLVHGPYACVTRKSRYSATLIFKSTEGGECIATRSGVFEVVVLPNSSDSGAAQCVFLAQADLDFTQGEIAICRLVFDVSNYVGSVLETRVFVEEHVALAVTAVIIVQVKE